MAGKLVYGIALIATLLLAATARGEKIRFTVPGTDGKTFDATLDLPAGAVNPTPVVVMLPGSDGIDQRQDFYRQPLLGAGIGTFVVDIKSGNFRSRRDRPPAAYFLPVGYEAVRVLRAHRGVDKTKIAVMGWSFGGTISVGLAHVANAPGWLNGEPGFAAHVGLYGGCTSRRSVTLQAVPVLVLIGSADTYTDPGRCSRFERLFPNASVVVYPGVHHGFDKEGIDRANNGRIMRWQEDTALDARARVVKFFIDTLRPGTSER